MVGGLYWFKLKHSHKDILYHINFKKSSKLYDEEIWLKITAVYSSYLRCISIIVESNEIIKHKSLHHRNCFFLMTQHIMCTLIIFI